MGNSVHRFWFDMKNNNSGEYVKDVDFSLLGQEKLLEHRFPRPVMEKGYCMKVGTWAVVEQDYWTGQDTGEQKPRAQRI